MVDIYMCKVKVANAPEFFGVKASLLIVVSLAVGPLLILPNLALITEPVKIAYMICISSPGVCGGKILVVIDGGTCGQE